MRETASGMLEELGCKVLTASGGREAHRDVSETESRIDTVLLDLTMPGLDGTATLRELTALDRNVRVIMMSGYDPVEAMTKVTGDACERTPYVSCRKPFPSSSDLRNCPAPALPPA